MKKILLSIGILMLVSLIACSPKKSSDKMNNNVLLKQFNTPFGAPPFSQITVADFKEAFLKGVKLQEKEIKAIVSNPEPAGFSNTIEALERSGHILKRTNTIFENLLSANTNDSLQKLAKEIAPVLSAHNDGILMNTDLFQRIKAVYHQKEKVKLNTEQNT